MNFFKSWQLQFISECQIVLKCECEVDKSKPQSSWNRLWLIIKRSEGFVQKLNQSTRRTQFYGGLKPPKWDGEKQGVYLHGRLRVKVLWPLVNHQKDCIGSQRVVPSWCRPDRVALWTTVLKPPLTFRFTLPHYGLPSCVWGFKPMEYLISPLDHSHHANCEVSPSRLYIIFLSNYYWLLGKFRQRISLCFEARNFVNFFFFIPFTLG